MGAHSEYSPSGVERKILCPGSLAAEAPIPEEESFWSAEGTVAHEVADMSFNGGFHPKKLLGREFTRLVKNREQVFTVDKEMVNAVSQYMNWCFEVEGDHYVERKVEVSKYTPKPNQFGTLDHAIAAPGRLTIKDLKYGEGEQVFAKRNPQLILYALGFIDEFNWAYNFESVDLFICQPRLDHHDLWSCRVDELRSIGTEIKIALHKTLDPNAPRFATKKGCRFCRARHQCRTLAESYEQKAALRYSDLDDAEPDLNTLSLEEIQEAYLARDLYKIRIAAVEQHLLALSASGRQLSLIKGVEGVAHRKFSNPAKAIEIMTEVGISQADQYKPRELITPKTALALTPPKLRKKLSEVIHKPKGKMTLVSKDDPRPEFHASYAELYSDLVDDESTEL